MKNNKMPGFMKAINATSMRHMNRSMILELVRQEGPMARSQISQALELSMPTVMRIVDELIAQDFIQAIGDQKGDTGHPREMLEYNKNGYAVIGVDLGGTKLYGALANIGGEVLDEVYQSQHGSTGENSFSRLCTILETLVRSSKNCHLPLLGIAVGAPGVTHKHAGIVEWAPSLNWRDFPLKEKLEERFNLPVQVENDVNLAVLGEQWFGSGKGVNNMVLLAIGTGMGAGLILDGAIYRGQTESAGEVGYMVSNVDALGRAYTGFGAMESIVSGSGIAERARIVLDGKISHGKKSSLTAMEVFNAARQGEEWAKQVVDETIDHLSITIANIACLLDPELIVLGGGVANAGDLLIPAIQRRLQGVIPHVPRIEASSLGTRATVMGAITLTVHTTKDYYVVRSLY
jgi:glucokinase-like ROK family protein